MDEFRQNAKLSLDEEKKSLELQLANVVNANNLQPLWLKKKAKPVACAKLSGAYVIKMLNTGPKMSSFLEGL